MYKLRRRKSNELVLLIVGEFFGNVKTDIFFAQISNVKDEDVKLEF